MKKTEILNYKGVRYELDKDCWKGGLLNDSIDYQYDDVGRSNYKRLKQI